MCVKYGPSLPHARRATAVRRHCRLAQPHERDRLSCNPLSCSRQHALPTCSFRCCSPRLVATDSHEAAESNASQGPPAGRLPRNTGRSVSRKALRSSRGSRPPKVKPSRSGCTFRRSSTSGPIQRGRNDAAVFGTSMSPRYQRRFTLTVCRRQSTSDHRNAIASPKRKPVTASSRTNRPVFASKDARSERNCSDDGMPCRTSASSWAAQCSLLDCSR